MQAIPIPTRRFSHIHINLVGPLPRSPEGANHLFTMVDRSSRWLEAIPLARTDMATIAATFISRWVARFGVPDHLTSYSGPQFCSALWSELSQWWGITSPPHTTHRPTGRSKGPTGNSKTLYEFMQTAATGCLTSLGFYWG